MRKIPDLVNHLGNLHVATTHGNGTDEFPTSSLAAPKYHGYLATSGLEQDLSFFVTVFSVTFGMLICFVAFLFYFSLCYPSKQFRKDSQGDSMPSSSPPSLDTPIMTSSFKRVNGMDGITRLFGWLSMDMEKRFVHTLQNSVDIEAIPPPWTINSVTSILSQRGIPMNRWKDDAKLFLAEELCSGKSRLLFQNGPIRAVELVLVVLKAPGGFILQELRSRAERYGFTLPEKIPNTRRLVNETPLAAAKRCLKDKLKIQAELIQLHCGMMGVTDTMENTDFLPGLKIVVRKYLVFADLVVNDADEAVVSKVGLSTGELYVGCHSYKWVSESNATGLVHHLHRRRASKNRIGKLPSFANISSPRERRRLRSADCTMLDGDIEPLLPWTETLVAKVCSKYGVHDFEVECGYNKSTIVSRLNDGTVSLGIRASDGKLLCLQERLSLLVKGPCNNRFLAELKGDSLAELAASQLPCGVKLSVEDAWSAAFRIAYNQIGLCSKEIVVEDSVQDVESRSTFEKDVDSKFVRQLLVRMRVAEDAAVVQDLQSQNIDSDSSSSSHASFKKMRNGNSSLTFA